MQKLARIDFAQLLRELDDAGVSPVAVADRLGIARSTPYRWLDGSEPLHSHGVAVLLLHATLVGIRHSETRDAQSAPARAVAVPAEIGGLSLDEVDRAVVKDREDYERSTVVPRHRVNQRRK